MGTEALMRGRVSRTLPQPDVDGMRDGEPLRAGRYDELYVVPIIRKQHGLADEGSYFVTNSGSQTGILSSAATGFVATTPACIIYNSDSSTNSAAKRICVDFVKLVTTVVGSAASALVRVEGAVYLDTGNRYSSGGTSITANIVNPNMDVPKSLSVANVYFGAITATAASGGVRAIDPYFVFRSTVSATVADVVGEQKVLNFGGVETMLNGSITIANANNITVPMPPLIIGPNQSALIYIWQAVGGTNVAATYAPNIGFWER
jgi:hypothetical protein